MTSQLGHVEIQIDPINLPFYRDLFAFLGWKTIVDDGNFLGLSSGVGPSIWFTPQKTKTSNDHDSIGVNHFGIAVNSIGEVDEVTKYLNDKNIAPLFETPRHRPDFASNENETYYQVMFESPDKLLWEVVYTGPKA